MVEKCIRDQKEPPCRKTIKAQDFEEVGLPSSTIFQEQLKKKGFFVDDVLGAHVINTSKGLIPAHLEVYITSNKVRTLADLTFEKAYVDDKERQWDSRIAVFPHVLELPNIDGQPQDIHLPRMAIEMPYQILVKQPIYPGPLMARIDSICTTSMIDGHRATNGHSALGCDCCGQRERGKNIIFNHPGGGASILCPWAGRGNGSYAHFGQHNIQSYYLENFGLEGMPTTYQTHEEQGFMIDRRIPFYFLDALLLESVRRAISPENQQIELLTNNPEKIRAVAHYGVEVIERNIYDESLDGYYKQPNFKDKATRGGHRPPQL